MHIGGNEEDRIKNFDYKMKCYRHMLKILWTDKITNDEIQTHLNISPNWLVHNVKSKKTEIFRTHPHAQQFGKAHHKSKIRWEKKKE